MCQKAITILLLLNLFYNSSFSQLASIANDHAKSKFYLLYLRAGLGSNRGSFEPTIKIEGTKLLYTYEQNSSYGERNQRIDTIFIKPFRQSSIDSILAIINVLGDTAIFRSNPGIMSGVTQFLNISNGGDTTRFEMMNTFDYTALKVANILNTYLPADQQIWANEKMINDADLYMQSLNQSGNASKQKKKERTKKNPL